MKALQEEINSLRNRLELKERGEGVKNNRMFMLFQK